jgi:hypothetical protein
LYQLMRGQGATNVRLVIGKRTPGSGLTHTWLEWTIQSATYVLDPTFNWSACSIRQIPSNFYVPYYAYAGARKYRVMNPDISQQDCSDIGGPLVPEAQSVTTLWLSPIYALCSRWRFGA